MTYVFKKGRYIKRYTLLIQEKQQWLIPYRPLIGKGKRGGAIVGFPLQPFLSNMKRVEKGLKQQYTARMKKLSFTQGKLLIKLVDRENNQTSYQLVKAFMGPLKAGFYQAFAALFGASLRKQYDPEGDDKLTERIVLMVESGQL